MWILETMSKQSHVQGVTMQHLRSCKHTHAVKNKRQMSLALLLHLPHQPYSLEIDIGLEVGAQGFGRLQYTTITIQTFIQ